MKITELQKCFGKLVSDDDYQDGLDFKFVCYTGDNEFIYSGTTESGMIFNITFVSEVSIDLFMVFKIDDYYDHNFVLFDCHKSLSDFEAGTCVFTFYPNAENSTFGNDRTTHKDN
tara:strand:+ start:349 stop:693 length:345 start_codon:yes stop_codon:yes gene_type:complete